jgi:hypothetical protein
VRVHVDDQQPVHTQIWTACMQSLLNSNGLSAWNGKCSHHNASISRTAIKMNSGGKLSPALRHEGGKVPQSESVSATWNLSSFTTFYDYKWHQITLLERHMLNPFGPYVRWGPETTCNLDSQLGWLGTMGTMIQSVYFQSGDHPFSRSDHFHDKHLIAIVTHHPACWTTSTLC